jgi:CheY-like chemotaxis protein
MRQILLVDDPATIAAMVAYLRRPSYHVTEADSGLQAIETAERLRPDVALIELRLPDMSGTQLLQALQRVTPDTVCIIVSGFATPRTAFDAMRLGAFDVLEKPVLGDNLVAVVGRALASRDAATPRSALTPITRGRRAPQADSDAVDRWADVVTRSIDAPADPRTLSDLGHLVGVSVGTFRNWCRTARLSSRRSLLFARMLRAVIRQPTDLAAPEDLLNVVDRRTLAKLLHASGGTSDRLPSIAEFFERQALISDERAVSGIRRALVASGRVPDGGEVRSSSHDARPRRIIAADRKS